MRAAIADKQGFTLVETIITITIFIIISVALGVFFVYYYQNFNIQQTIVNMVGAASGTASELQNIILQADKIMANHDFSGTVYETNQNTLVLELPSIDGSGDIISGKYDYAVFYATGTSFYKLIQGDPSSARLSGLKQLSGIVLSLVFTYNNGDLNQADKVSVDMQMQTTVSRQIVSHHFYQEIYLRNR